MFLLKLLGSFSLLCDTAPVPPGAQQKRRVGLLALLAIGGERGVSRDRLQSYLWPESPASRSRHALDQLIYATRRSLGSDPILSEGRDLRLDPSIMDSDIHAFGEAIRDSRLANAAAIYAGPLLDGFHISDSRELEAWIDGERARLEHEYHKALEMLASRSAAESDHAAAVSWLRKLATSDPLSARVASEFIQALTAAGDPAGAIQYARNYQQLVRSELEVEPDPKIEGLITTLSGPRVTETARPEPSGDQYFRHTASRSKSAEAGSFSEPATRPGPSTPSQSRTRFRSLAIVSLLIVAIAGSLAVLRRAQGENVQRNVAARDRAVRDPRTRAVNPDAKAFYLRGMNAWSDRSKSGLDTAVVYFRRALEVDPAYAEAYAGLANAYVLLGYSGYRPSDAMFPKAKAAALRAIQLDSSFAAPYAALGMGLSGERDFRAAETAFRKAITVDPQYATAHQWYGILLMILGRTDEAVAETGRAARLDPLSLQIQNNYATFLSASGQHAAALRHYQNVVGEEPDSSWVRRNPWLLTNMASVYAANGQYQKAIRYAERAVEINPGHPRGLSVLASIYDRMEQPRMALAIFARADTTNEHYAAYRAFRYAADGNADSAFIWFDRVREWGIPVMITLGSPGSAMRIRQDPRFGDLLKRLGMPVPVPKTTTSPTAAR
ncbi:MAG: tetratricopeptide repeat protein [Gemmatimonadaceae bacterium]|nr:tetratricopeptide repeat protein [Gemmatimonadaceae bacterium]